MPLIRIHQSFLSRPERRLIDWLVPRLPRRVTPDILTALGTVGALLTLAGYWLSSTAPSWLWLASFGLLVHWFGDSLDGNLARFRQSERPRYGFFLDQSIDVLGNFFICFGLGLSPFVSMNVALLALTGYHMIAIYVLIRATVAGDFHVTVLNSGPTEMRVLLVLMNTLILLFGAKTFEAFGVAITWCDVIVGLFAAGFMITFVYLVFSFAPILRESDDTEREARQARERQGEA